MKIAICGASTDVEEEILKKCYEIGKEIAENKAITLTGAGRGYPIEAAKGAFENNGEVIGYSPAKDESEQKEVYGFSTDFHSKIIYTGEGIPKRNYDLVMNSDAIIIIGGQIGTLNEFTIAFQQDKVIGVLGGSGGVTEILDKVIGICDKKDRSSNVIYSYNAKELVSEILERLKK